MKVLTGILKIKIFLTVVLWASPLLLFPGPLLMFLGIQPPDQIVFMRLLGAAYWALIVGYYFGLVEIRAGRCPIGVVWMGITSNGLASTILVWFGATGRLYSWSLRGQAFMWISAVLALGLSGLLYRYRPLGSE